MQAGIWVLVKSWPGRATMLALAALTTCGMPSDLSGAHSRVAVSTKSASIKARRISPSPLEFELIEPLASSRAMEPFGAESVVAELCRDEFWSMCWTQAKLAVKEELTAKAQRSPRNAELELGYLVGRSCPKRSFASFAVVRCRDEFRSACWNGMLGMGSVILLKLDASSWAGSGNRSEAKIEDRSPVESGRSPRPSRAIRVPLRRSGAVESWPRGSEASFRQWAVLLTMTF